jgi:hypothetical protein
LRSEATRFSSLDIASVDIELLPDDTQLRDAFALIAPQPVSQGERGLRASGRGKAKGRSPDRGSSDPMREAGAPSTEGKFACPPHRR